MGDYNVGLEINIFLSKMQNLKNRTFFTVAVQQRLSSGEAAVNKR